MNHLELFLNASTQMIFIVYASLSVLRGFHVSTFLKGDRNSPAEQTGPPYPMLPLQALVEGNILTLLLDKHQNRGTGIPGLISSACR